MNTFTIYLCGGMQKFGKDNFDESNTWRKYCKDTLSKCDCDYKVKVINPNDYFNFKDNPIYQSDKEVMDFDLYKVKKSNLILVNFNDIYSLGTMAELAIAYENKIPIIGIHTNVKTQLHPWQKSMCNRITNDIDSAIDYIEDFYLR